MTATARDLIDLARDRGEPIPLLSAATILVQILSAVAARHRRGLVHKALNTADAVLGADSLTTLLADPSRDPKVSLIAATETGGGTGRAEDIGAVAAVAVELLTGGNPMAGVPPVLEPLLRKMRAPRRSARPTAIQAHAEARAIALELFAVEERTRCASRLEECLRRVLDERRESRVRELVAELEEMAPGSLMLRVAHQWLRRLDKDRVAADDTRRRLSAALYAGRRKAVERLAGALADLLGDTGDDDPDLRLARAWLAEERRREARHRAAVRRTSLKLVYTGAPLLLATLLSGLLAVVMVWAG